MIDFVASTASTNADLLRRLRSDPSMPEGYWLVTDRQHRGRGRQGRAWLDAAGNFMGSTIIPIAAGDPAVTTLPLACGLAVLRALLPSVSAPAQLQLKWPNDVLLRNDKVAGILLEREGDAIVAGFGVNLAVAPAIPDRALGTLSEIGPRIDRDSFAHNMAAALDRELWLWRQHGAGDTIDRWMAAAHAVDSVLAVHDDLGGRVVGRFAGLQPDGALRLELADGDIRIIHAGDVAVEGDGA